jgi:predicted flap endonuclease-1-like 5' DNA nuclease
MQEDLMKLFSERFDELSSKIEELRSKTEAKPIKEVAISPKKITEETPISDEKAAADEKTKKKRKPPAKPSPRTEAEKRIEEIRAEVEKVLDRLGQMEIES